MGIPAPSLLLWPRDIKDSRDYSLSWIADPQNPADFLTKTLGGLATLKTCTAINLR